MLRVPQLKKLLAEDFKLAINEFERELDSSNTFYNELLEIKGRFNHLEKERNRGIIEYNNYSIELNKLRVAAIALLDKIQNLQINHESDKSKLSGIKFDSKKSSSWNYTRLFFAIFLIVFLGAICYSYFLKDSNKTEEVKTVLDSYYKTLIAKEFNNLGVFYSDPIERYYDQKSVYLDAVIKDLKASKQNVIKEKVDIDWNSFELEKTDNLYHLEYLMNYQQKKLNENSIIYHLRMKVILDSNLKIKSIYEIKE